MERDNKRITETMMPSAVYRLKIKEKHDYVLKFTTINIFKSDSRRMTTLFNKNS